MKKQKANFRSWNLFSIKGSNLWKKFFYLFKKVITPRFLYEIIIPQDILNVISEIKFPKKSHLNGEENVDPNVFRFILASSIFNGILIGMPGTAGWGVLAAQAVEVLMAVQIAIMVGLLDFSIFSYQKILKFFSAAALTAICVVYLFKKALSIIFNILGNFVPSGFTTLSAEIVTTLFYGLFLYLCFIEINNFGGNKKGKTVSLSMLPRIVTNASKYTIQISKSLFKLLFNDMPRLLGEIKQNIEDTWYGVVDIKARIKGEIFLAGCLAYLMDKQFDKLNGPFANLWLQAWRDSFPSKLNENSNIEEISVIANSYNKTELERVINTNINPKFFEILETTHENSDGDVWSAELMETQNNPISDAIFFNSKTGQSFEINYKFSESKNYIENHIQLHPDVPVVATADIAEKINSPLVLGGNFEYDEVLELSEQNFEEFLNLKHSLYLEAGAIGGGVISLTYHLLPFLIAYYRGSITREQLAKALKRFIPEITGRTINRIAMLSLLGPVYGAFLIASLIGKATLYGFEEKETEEEETTSRKQEKKRESEETDSDSISKPKQKFSRRDIINLSFLGEIN